MNIPLWFSNLVFWSIQVGLLALAAGFLLRALTLRPASVLLAYWRSLLAISLLLPFLEPWNNLPSIGAPVISTDFIIVPLVAPSTPSSGRWHALSLQTVAPIFAIVILAGIALRFVILAFGLLKLRRLRQASRPIETSPESAAVLEAARTLVAASAKFRLSTQVDSPVTFGLAAPVVLFPDRFTSLEPRFQSAIACHELLHVRRQDWAHNLAEELLRALFWFHPAIGWFISRIRLAREQVVDREVVSLTNDRRTYVEALLEFTSARPCLTSIPAPPFLAEHQLIDRVSFMLKELHMSRKRLIFSLGLISCCLALVVALAAWSFPLKAQARSLTASASGGTSDDLSARASQNEPSVDISTVWTDTAKRGAMPLHVRGAGTLVHEEESLNWVAQVTVPASMATDIKPGQNATLTSKLGGLGTGRVISVSPLTPDSRTVEIALSAAPQGNKPGLALDANIDVGKLDNVLYIGRPVNSTQNSGISLFKIIDNGSEAVRTNVKLGRVSVNTVEVLSGLNEGDKVIISDMSRVQNADRVRLTDEKRPSSH